MLELLQGYEVSLALLVVTIPLVTSIAISILPEQFETREGSIATVLQGVAFIIALILAPTLLFGGEIYYQQEWLRLSSDLQISFGLQLDALTGLMLVIVSLISFLVNMFSIQYMAGDNSYRRYFILLGLFTFSMLGVVVSDNLLQLFIFWELVGFTSYLLIGFWFHKPSAALASKKAFIVNKIADLGFVVALMIFWTQYGSLDILTLHNVNALDSFWVNVAGVGLFIGVIGKSAQFPLQIWLPDAMEGPTPVSALIHAATMVVAGVFLLARVFILLSPDVLQVVSVVGAITAFTGAIAAINQHDIKKVLAFSTISQLGYMVVGIGVRATGGAIFHLVTHAFFKACLFLSAGAIIYWVHRVNSSVDAQNMNNMGGLRKRLPLVFVTFTMSAMTLVGLPLFSGFLSKDAILVGVWQQTVSQSDTMSMLVMILTFVSVLLTGYYMTRQVFIVFFGKPRMEIENQEGIQEVPISMKIPLIILSIGSIWTLFSFNPMSGSTSWLMSLFASDFEIDIPHKTHLLVPVIATILSVSGIVLGYYKFRNYKTEDSSKGVVLVINKLSYNHWYLDQIYKKVFVTPTLIISKVILFIDIQVVDRLVNYFGIANIIISRLVGWGDRHLVDGAVHVAASGISGIGIAARKVQGNQVQRYILTAILIVAFIAIVIAVYLNSINH